jgi:hypothetical protein
MQLQQSGADTMSGSRKGKMQIGGHFDPSDVFTLQMVIKQESIKSGVKKTMQDALEEMVRDYCGKHGVKLPSSTRPTDKARQGRESV